MITVEKTVGAEATMWRRLHRVVFVVLGFSYSVNRSEKFVIYERVTCWQIDLTNLPT